jgi:hypothetical protein
MLPLLFFMVSDGLKDRFLLAGGHIIAVMTCQVYHTLVCVQLLGDPVCLFAWLEGIISPVGCIEVHYFRLWT